MRHREFVLVRVRASSGHVGFAFTLTRDAPIDAALRSSVAGRYVGASFEDPAALFHRAQRSNLASLSAGIGLRALSLADIATWDLKARSKGASMTRLLGGTPRRMPATAIVGYPPGSCDAARIYSQVRQLREEGWMRFELAVTLPLERARDRVLAAREAGGEDAWVGLDGAWVFHTVEEARDFLDSVREARLGWFEDIFPPGDAELVADLKTTTEVPIAMGDEQGGSYYPDALLARRAVDVVRLDLTCMGGVTSALSLVERCERARVQFAPHMYAHLHSQVFAALDRSVPIEWGVPGTGVDQYADSLQQPTITSGEMEPLPETPGFGPLVNVEWLGEQVVDDPDDLVASLTTV
jgi:L-alanine-DL-glutamate epimerase-like enolase superfamily enzyme